MGLDVTAYQRLRLIEATDGYDDAHDDDVRIHNEPLFIERADGMTSGYYQSVGRIVQFAAGSYSSYNRWREQLAALVGVDLKAVWAGHGNAVPFYELLHFSDCEGTIGPKTSEKLSRDFDAWIDRGVVYSRTIDNGAYWIERYAEWSEAFHLAAGEGAVTLH